LRGNFGAVIIPRIGMGVVVTYLDGNPDHMLQAEFFTDATKYTELMDADYQRGKTVVDWTSGGLAPIDAFNPEYGNSAIDFYSPTSYLRRLEQAGIYLQDLIETDKWRVSLGCVRTGLKPAM
jgi:iron complex outermembrane receptor protein